MIASNDTGQLRLWNRIEVPLNSFISIGNQSQCLCLIGFSSLELNGQKDILCGLRITKDRVFGGQVGVINLARLC